MIGTVVRNPVGGQSVRPPGDWARTVHVAVVSAADGPVTTLASRSSKGLEEQVFRYVEKNAALKLWPDDARKVVEFGRAGKKGTAITLYFRQVGQRWDPEQLHRNMVELA